MFDGFRAIVLFSEHFSNATFQLSKIRGKARKKKDENSEKKNLRGKKKKNEN